MMGFGEEGEGGDDGWCGDVRNDPTDSKLLLEIIGWWWWWLDSSSGYGSWNF